MWDEIPSEHGGTSVRALGADEAAFLLEVQEKKKRKREREREQQRVDAAVFKQAVLREESRRDVVSSSQSKPRFSRLRKKVDNAADPARPKSALSLILNHYDESSGSESEEKDRKRLRTNRAAEDARGEQSRDSSPFRSTSSALSKDV